MHPNYNPQHDRRHGAPDFDELHGWHADHADPIAQLDLEARAAILRVVAWLAAGVAIIALLTILAGHALTRAEARPAACDGLTGAECAAAMWEAR